MRPVIVKLKKHVDVNQVNVRARVYTGEQKKLEQGCQLKVSQFCDEAMQQDARAKVRAASRPL
jgi:hypothetical protein